jgi:hypothetical protein
MGSRGGHGDDQAAAIGRTLRGGDGHHGEVPMVADADPDEGVGEQGGELPASRR